MPLFKYRLLFQLAHSSTFSGEEETAEITVAATGEQITLQATSGGRTLGSSSQFALTGGPFDTEQEAQRAGEAAMTAVLYNAVKNRVGINLGTRYPSTVLTLAGKAIFSERLGKRVEADNLGLVIYEAEPKPAFLYPNMVMVVRRGLHTFTDTIAAAYQRYTLPSERIQLALELFASSFFEKTPRARFLILVIALEVLLERERRTEDVQALVQDFMTTARMADLPTIEKQPLLSGLEALVYKSVGQSGRELAKESLEGETYAGLTPDKFFNKIYKMRSNLTHGESDVLTDRSVQDILTETERFVSDMLLAHFEADKEEAPEA